MNVVVDANAAIEIALQRPRAETFRGLLDDVDYTLAPSLMVSETANALWKCHRIDGAPLEGCRQALEAAIDCVDEWIPDEELASEALALACSHSHAAYDMFYLALARATGAALLTMDTRLKAFAREHKVRLLDEASG
jgi:predicted nucleic acid-binding protein